MQQFHTPDKPKIVKSAETPEVSGEIGKTSTEREAEIRSEIAGKEKLVGELRKSGQAKLESLEAMERAHDEELITLARLNVAGRLSAETLEAEQASRKEKEEELKRDMKKYFDDAVDLEREIASLKGELGGSEN